MNKNSFWVNFLLLLAAIYISSIIQLLLLHFFPNLISFKNSISFKLIGYSWAGGIGLDLASFVLFTLPSLLFKKNISPLSIGLLFSVSSHLFYGFPCLFLNYQVLPLPLQSLVKVLEFLLIISFHVLFMWVLPNLVDKYIQKSLKKR
jgi:hypothetical protein